MSRPVLLLGFMCSGKTTLGKALAERLGVSFTDLDEEIESRAGMSVGEIFRREGEASFRNLEARTLSEVLSGCPGGIVALGGGTPCREGAMEALGHSGLTVWLRPSAQRLVPRLMEGRSGRPLLRGISSEKEMEEFVRLKAAERDPFYSKARCTFDSSFLEAPEEIRESVDRFIAEVLGGDLPHNI